MTAPSLSIPQYRPHASGQARVTLDGRDVYLGPHGSPESRIAYERVVGEWLARGRVSPADQSAKDGPTVNEVMLVCLRWAESYYRDPDGQPTREVGTMKLAFRPLKALYGLTPAAAFGPLALKVVRQQMIDDGLCRNVINQRVKYIRRLFKWAASEELIPPATYHGLLSVDALKRGRSGVRDTEPVKPVPDAHVDAILPFLPPTVRAMVQLQRLTGMRSGELVRMRTCDIETTGSVWFYRPAKHKTAHLGHKRAVALGEQSQAIIRPFLRPEMRAYLFSPRQAEAERDQIMRQRRKTRVQPSQLGRRKPDPKKSPGDCYDTCSYLHAVRYAMEAAHRVGKLARQEFWHPHQLRHSAALRIQREHGLEAARAFLGHATPDLTAHYAGFDEALAVKVARQCG